MHRWADRIRVVLGTRLPTLLAACLVAPTQVSAGSGFEIQLPVSMKQMKSGLTVRLTSHWVEAVGYRPVRIVANPDTALHGHASDPRGYSAQ